MKQISQIETQREAILNEMRSLRAMRKGSVSQQYLKVKQKGKAEPVLRGPYYTFTCKEGSKTIGHRLKTPEELAQAQRETEAHKRFWELCRQYEQLTERLGELERAGAEDSLKKKRRRSPSSGTRK